MNRHFLSYITLVALFLGGCAPYRTAAVQASIDINVALKENDRNVAACTRAFEQRHAASVALVDSLLVINSDDPKRLEKLLIKDQMSADQKRVALDLWNSYDCRGQWLHEISKVAKPQEVVWREYFVALDALRVRLLQDEVTIGRFNQIKLELDAIRDKNRLSATQLMNEALSRQHYEEVNARNQSAIASAAYMSAINAATTSSMSQTRSLNCSVVNNRIHCLSF